MRPEQRFFSFLVSHIGTAAQPLLFSCACCAAMVIAGRSVAFAADYDPLSFTPEQLNTAIKTIGPPTQKIYSMRTFYDMPSITELYVTILSSFGSGWHVTVLHRVQTGLHAEWRSGKLPQDFAVSSASQLKVEDLDGEPVVEFAGCAPHDCGGVDGVMGVLLYSPRSKQAFYAHYRFDEGKPLGSFGSVEFSDNVSRPGNEKYREALRKALAKALDHGVP